MALSMIFGMVGCGGTSNTDTVETNEAGEVIPPAETIDTGRFTVNRPQGWSRAESIDDFTGEPDIDSAILVYDIHPEMENDACTVKIYYYENQAMANARAWYQHVEDIDVTIGDVECDAFTGVSLDNTYAVINYPYADGITFQIQVMLENAATGAYLDVDSRDVQDILSSIAIGGVSTETAAE